MRPFIRSIEDTEFDGGLLCLDFVNTVRNRHEEPVYEYLRTAEDWLTWTRRKGLLTRGALNNLNQKSVNANELNQVLTCREDLYQIFRAIVNGKRPTESQESALNKHFMLLFRHLSIVVRGGKRVEWVISMKKDSLLLPLLYVIQSAYELVTGNQLDRIKECDGCGWLYFDKSKNLSRRWCNMQTCGSTDKTQRYYYKQKDLDE